MIGDLPYAGRARVLERDAAEWADRCAEAAEPDAGGPHVLRVQPPAAAGSPLTAELHAPRLGHPEHRVLRRAARDWPPLDRIRRDGTLGGEDAAELLGPAGDRLAAHGIKIEWPGRPGPGPRREHDRAATEPGQRVLTRRYHRPDLAAGPGRRTALRSRGGTRSPPRTAWRGYAAGGC